VPFGYTPLRRLTRREIKSTLADAFASLSFELDPATLPLDEHVASYGLGVLNHMEGVQGKRRLCYASQAAGIDVVNDPLRAFDDLLAGVSADGGESATEDLKRRLGLRGSRESPDPTFPQSN